MLAKKSFLALAAFLLVACSAGLAQSDQPSLADLARQNRAAKKAVKVLTEDDIPPAQRSAAIVTGAATKQAAENAAPSPKPPAGDPKAAATGNRAATISELRQVLNSIQEQLKGWQRSARHYEGLLELETSDFRRQMYQDALENDRKNASVFQKKVDQLQSELAAAEKASEGASSAGSTQPAQNAALGK
jgi:hypothetical protein